ncbi:MAG: hypothetical protein ACRDN0_01275 [Trebonia sp.]
MHSGDFIDRRRRGRLIGSLVVACLGFLLFGAAGINAILIDTGVRREATEHPGASETVLAIFLLGLAVCCAMWAIHCEHRLRGLPPGRLAVAAESAHASVPMSWRARPRRRRYGPTSTIVFGAIFAVIGIVMIPLTFSSHAQADKSGYTQSNGVADNAMVTNVDNEKSCGRSSCTYYAYVTVTLSQPIDGAATATVNIPQNVSYNSGQVISVLVDPKDPGYAELPGRPYATNSSTVGMAIGAAIFLLIGAFTVFRGIRMRQRRHVWHSLRPAGA